MRVGFFELEVKGWGLRVTGGGCNVFWDSSFGFRVKGSRFRIMVEGIGPR